MKKMILCAFTALYTIVAIPATLFAQQRREPISSFDRPAPRITDRQKTKIQVAILLDTSGSMDGLIEQAKSRLWNIINTLSTLRFRGQQPLIEIALYEYGNDGIPAKNNYVRLVTPLTTDLDLISEKLFSLSTNGGSEYCGAVIKKAAQQLEWSDNSNDIKLIYIAGNEPFTQGQISYKEALSLSNQKQITTNTIFCGDYNEGINTMWKDGASKGNGKYFNINYNEKVRFIETPYDDQISVYNDKLNSTYVTYGNSGATKKAVQMRQDYNAESLGKANKVERSVSKSKAAYSNQSWDLVDKMNTDQSALKSLDKNYLPTEIKDKSEAEIKKYVQAKAEERTAYQTKIKVLAKQRQDFIDQKMKADKPDADDLGSAINNSIIELAGKKGYVIDKN
ncbi:hypothetical protein DBR32_06335 [Taibaiella sp. KBW10]|uniref:vWA domain-containing protein n=1 Tax=Taibaiella sp. KBW10 TaxID=2153357 RepID=UPI000F5B2BE7|nr:vWA domain-containing protein [Taibaiella sp. KBW10]RQO31572.1 hypothetical protein DBR32_06335 [Taibaiella sp. KBW10]